MKKIGLIAGISFLAGALFFALSFGYFQKSESHEPILEPLVVRAESVKLEGKVGMSFAPLVKKVKPAVVKVMSESIREGRSRNRMLEQFFNVPRRREKVPGVGSGFFISSDGYIITNNHVVQKAITVRIKTSDDKEYKAKIVGTDPKTDLALLKIKAKNLPFIELGDSNKVEVGEWVLAIGNPLNQDLTVTSGIISAKGRQLGLADYEDFLQTDAAINMGNSGGPLVNMDGDVIGINSVILAPSGGNVGIGFAIPSSMAQKVINDLKNEGRVVRGYLGIGISTLTEEDAKELDYPTGGVMVQRVEKGSPAEQAGLKKYDLLVKVNGHRVKKDVDLSTRIANVSPGDIAKLEIYRKSTKKIISVTVGEDNVDDFREIISERKPGSLLLLYVNRNGDEGVIRFRLPE